MPRDALPEPSDWDVTVAAWVSSLSSDNTRAAYRSDLLKFGEWCATRRALPLRASVADVVAYQAAIEAGGASVSTSRRRSSSLSSFFAFAVAAGAAATNPVNGTIRPSAGASSTTPLLDRSGLDRIVAEAAAFDPRAHALVALLAFDGLKLNETLALDTDHLVACAPDSIVATVERSGRTTSLTLDARTALAVTTCAAGRESAPLFTNQRAERLSRFGADHLLKRLPAVDGVPLTANALRRFFVTAAHAAGVAVDEISRRAGVDDVRTAQRYLIASPSEHEDDTKPSNHQPNHHQPNHHHPIHHQEV